MINIHLLKNETELAKFEEEKRIKLKQIFYPIISLFSCLFYISPCLVFLSSFCHPLPWFHFIFAIPWKKTKNIPAVLAILFYSQFRIGNKGTPFPNFVKIHMYLYGYAFNKKRWRSKHRTIFITMGQLSWLAKHYCRSVGIDLWFQTNWRERFLLFPRTGTACNN